MQEIIVVSLGFKTVFKTYRNNKSFHIHKRQKFLPFANGKNAISNGKNFSYDRKKLFWFILDMFLLPPLIKLKE